VKVVEVLGKQKAMDIFRETRKIEEDGGMMVLVCSLAHIRRVSRRKFARVYAALFDKNLPSKIGVQLMHGIFKKKKEPRSSKKKPLSYR
jgi:hypothetical protein